MLDCPDRLHRRGDGERAAAVAWTRRREDGVVQNSRRLLVRVVPLDASERYRFPSLPVPARWAHGVRLLVQPLSAPDQAIAMPWWVPSRTPTDPSSTTSTSVAARRYRAVGVEDTRHAPTRVGAAHRDLSNDDRVRRITPIVGCTTEGLEFDVAVEDRERRPVRLCSASGLHRDVGDHPLLEHEAGSSSRHDPVATAGPDDCAALDAGGSIRDRCGEDLGKIFGLGVKEVLRARA